MNRESVLLRAVADVVKERMSRNGNKVQMPLTADLVVPPVDMRPIAEANERVMYALQELVKTPPQVNVDMTPIAESNEKVMYALEKLAKNPPQIKVTVPQSPPAQITVNVDLAPLADAIQKQTDALEKVVGKMMTCLEKGLDKGKEIEIIKDSAGRITGARRK